MTAMTTMTAYDQRLAEHHTRVARVNQHAWKRPPSRPAGIRYRARPASFLVALRREVGMAIVQFGERLQGTPAGNVADRAAA